MRRLISFDDSSITVGIVPQVCGACGGHVDRVRMALDAVGGDDGGFLGIRTAASTPCCGNLRKPRFPAEQLARLLNHLQNCPNHQNVET
ncbi:hypothetical protein ACWD7M_16970 [Streptomyces griseus]